MNSPRHSDHCSHHSLTKVDSKRSRSKNWILLAPFHVPHIFSKPEASRFECLPKRSKTLLSNLSSVVSREYFVFIPILVRSWNLIWCFVSTGLKHTIHPQHGIRPSQGSLPDVLSLSMAALYSLGVYPNQVVLERDFSGLMWWYRSTPEEIDVDGVASWDRFIFMFGSCARSILAQDASP